MLAVPSHRQLEIEQRLHIEPKLIDPSTRTQRTIIHKINKKN